MGDDEIKHEQDTPIDVPSDVSDATREQILPEVPAFTPVATKLPIVTPKSTSRKGLVIVLVLLGILSLGCGSAFAYYVMSSNKQQPVANNVATPAPPATQKPLVADALLYETSVPGKNVGACSTSLSTLYRQPINGGTATKVLDASDYQAISEQDAYKDQLIVLTSPTCASKTGSQIWYSADSGMTFTKLYENPSKDDAITSAKFDSTGKTVVLGYLANGSIEATVKQVDVFKKTTKDLFKASKAGVYIKGFNAATGRVYYDEGCYGCDAVSNAELSVYDIQKKTIATLYKEDTASYNVRLNKDFSKGIKIRAVSPTTANSKGYNDVNYVIDEFDATTGTMTPLTTSELTNVPSLSITAGYTDDGMVYYVKDKDINILGSNKKISVLLTADNPIATVYTVGKDTVIYKNMYKDDGSQNAKTDVYTDRAVFYDIKTKKSTPIVTFKDHQSVILSIAWK